MSPTDVCFSGNFLPKLSLQISRKGKVSGQIVLEWSGAITVITVLCEVKTRGSVPCQVTNSWSLSMDLKLIWSNTSRIKSWAPLIWWWCWRSRMCGGGISIAVIIHDDRSMMEDCNLFQQRRATDTQPLTPQSQIALCETGSFFKTEESAETCSNISDYSHESTCSRVSAALPTIIMTRQLYRASLLLGLSLTSTHISSALMRIRLQLVHALTDGDRKWNIYITVYCYKKDNVLINSFTWLGTRYWVRSQPGPVNQIPGLPPVETVVHWDPDTGAQWAGQTETTDLSRVHLLSTEEQSHGHLSLVSVQDPLSWRSKQRLFH